MLHPGLRVFGISKQLDHCQPLYIVRRRNRSRNTKESKWATYFIHAKQYYRTKNVGRKCLRGVCQRLAQSVQCLPIGKSSKMNYLLILTCLSEMVRDKGFDCSIQCPTTTINRRQDAVPMGKNIVLSRRSWLGEIMDENIKTLQDIHICRYKDSRP